MTSHHRPRTARVKYGEELRLRRTAAGLTQEALSEQIVCSPTLISHFEAGRRLPNPDDAQRIDRALSTDGFFARWLEDLDTKFVDHFAAVAELERHATEIRQFGLTLVPGLLQTDSYARALFRAYRPNHRSEELDRDVVIRTERGRVLDSALNPVVWTLLDEAVLRRHIGGPAVMAEQLRNIAGLADAGRIRLHIVPFEVGAHALLQSLVTLLSFDDSAPVAYVEGFMTGHLMDDPAAVRASHTAYALSLGDALSHDDSLALVQAAAEELEHGQQ
ncbi:helix-turn-helix transcriptional regulator [[Kitasatospora] papulosa]|jgi:transcriptional regulator with XRE-family HTH domain|uniref:helix-turn-helix domain-containing protein n=1 Tax=Streptomyces TaxID=1883 RepID=UPI000524CA45|nr:helix-turn-helix transcriptional regulator [[Kitasatospora] papulosa]MBD2833274.1 helix-turn-helix transcriptional regulator [Streptomyces pratensis]RAS30143.1 helix-turn-helix protein [Streptomyces avidinii]SNX77866.1 Helix-turn-helix domain-containing protein [Streptomyces microflavus]MCX4414938.1 helix-turn-helix transcriptional regulator [[Kitasatospora] papulosa]MDF9870818.1 transcriptional regulator with XRE-family HTH domain [Streptomyces pratensis]